MSYQYQNFRPTVKKQFTLDGENTIYPYGKYSGSTLKEILLKDVNYFQWLENNNSISGLSDIIKQMKITYSIFIFEKLNKLKEILNSVITLEPYVETTIEVTFDTNLHIYQDDSGKELFAYFKYNQSDSLVFNIIFSEYKELSWNGLTYFLPLDKKGVSKKIKGRTFILKVEPRKPYSNKTGTKMVQNLIVKEFTKKSS